MDQSRAPGIPRSTERSLKALLRCFKRSYPPDGAAIQAMATSSAMVRTVPGVSRAMVLTPRDAAPFVS
jgi:hypothetical protein